MVQLRDLIYPAAGLNATTGQPVDCSIAGKVMLKAAQGVGYGLSAGGGSSLSLDPARCATGPDLCEHGSCDLTVAEAVLQSIFSDRGGHRVWAWRMQLTSCLPSF